MSVTHKPRVWLTLVALAALVVATPVSPQTKPIVKVGYIRVFQDARGKYALEHDDTVAAQFLEYWRRMHADVLPVPVPLSADVRQGLGAHALDRLAGLGGESVAMVPER